MMFLGASTTVVRNNIRSPFPFFIRGNLVRRLKRPEDIYIYPLVHAVRRKLNSEQ